MPSCRALVFRIRHPPHISCTGYISKHSLIPPACSFLFLFFFFFSFLISFVRLLFILGDFLIASVTSLPVFLSTCPESFCTICLLSCNFFLTGFFGRFPNSYGLYFLPRPVIVRSCFSSSRKRQRRHVRRLSKTYTPLFSPSIAIHTSTQPSTDKASRYALPQDRRSCAWRHVRPGRPSQPQLQHGCRHDARL